MTENNKPEWFEIAESDGPARPQKVRTTLPIAAVMAAALIIGVGAVVAQTQEESPASATETTSVATTQSVAPATTNTEVQNVVATAVTKPRSIATTSAASNNNSAIVNPSISKLPTGGGDDDDDEGEHGKRGHHEDEGDEDEGDAQVALKLF